MNFLPLDVALSDALEVVRHFPSSDAALVAIQTAENALAAAKAELVQESIAAEEFKDHGFASINAYLRERLHLSGGEANQVRRRGQTIRRLAEQIGDDAATGRIQGKHVDEFGYAITTLTEDGVQLPEVAEVLSSAAREADPTVLLPEALEKAYVDGPPPLRASCGGAPIGQEGSEALTAGRRVRTDRLSADRCGREAADLPLRHHGTEGAPGWF